MGCRCNAERQDVIPCKCTMKVKRDPDGIEIPYKARFVVFGNRDNEELTRTFAPAVDVSIVRLMLSIAVQKDWKVHHVDCSSAFEHGMLNCEVYMTMHELMIKGCIGKV